MRLASSIDVLKIIFLRRMAHQILVLLSIRWKTKATITSKFSKNKKISYYNILDQYNWSRYFEKLPENCIKIGLRKKVYVLWGAWSQYKGFLMNQKIKWTRSKRGEIRNSHVFISEIWGFEDTRSLSSVRFIPTM